MHSLAHLLRMTRLTKPNLNLFYQNQPKAKQVINLSLHELGNFSSNNSTCWKTGETCLVGFMFLCASSPQMTEVLLGSDPKQYLETIEMFSCVPAEKFALFGTLLRYVSLEEGVHCVGKPVDMRNTRYM